MLLLLALLSLVAAVKVVSVPSEYLELQRLGKDIYGYSVEAESVLRVTGTNLARGIFDTIKSITGVSPYFRMGGITNDHLIVSPNQDKPEINLGSKISVRKDWFEQWGNYWSDDTKIIFTTNFQDRTNGWGNGSQLAEWAIEVLGDRLEALEFGNEIDHYSWGADPTKEYVELYFRFNEKLKSLPWWKNTPINAAVFADPPGFPDQVYHPGMNVVNAIEHGLVDSGISAYVVHLYPQSTCDAPRVQRLSLPTLSNHAVVWANISQFTPDRYAATNEGVPLVLGETNSISCRGRSGISDTFGAALWGVDYCLTAAALGIPQVYWHLHAESDYSAFVPYDYEVDGKSLQHGIRANFYTHLFLAHVVSGSDEHQVAALPDANSTDFSGFGVFSSDPEKTLKKLVFVDLGIWNTSYPYISNPTTNSDYDSTYVSEGERPIREVIVMTPWQHNTEIEVVRLMGEGTNAKSGVNVSGTTVSNEDGSLQGALEQERLIVGNDGIVRFSLLQAQAVLLTVVSNNNTIISSTPPTKGSASIYIILLQHLKQFLYDFSM